MTLEDQKKFLNSYSKPRPFQTINVIMAGSFVSFAISCCILLLMIVFTLLILSFVNEGNSQVLLVLAAFVFIGYLLGKSIFEKITYGNLLKNGEIESAKIVKKEKVPGRFSTTGAKTETEYTIELKDKPESQIKQRFSGTKSYGEQETLILRQEDRIFPLSIFLHHNYASIEQLLEPSFQKEKSNKSGWGAFISRMFVFVFSIAVIFVSIIIYARS